MKENWYALLAAIQNPKYKYAAPALRAMGVKGMKPKNPLKEERRGDKTKRGTAEGRLKS